MLNMVSPGDSSPEKKNERKTWTWILVDSAIVGGIAFAATMGNTPPDWTGAWIMFKAFLGAFLLQLGVERGLKKAPPQE